MPLLNAPASAQIHILSFKVKHCDLNFKKYFEVLHLVLNLLSQG